MPGCCLTNNHSQCTPLAPIFLPSFSLGKNQLLFRKLQAGPWNIACNLQYGNRSDQANIAEGIDMFRPETAFKKRVIGLLPVAALALPGLSSAETFEFKVVYAEVPGIEKILAGDFDSAIARLEERARNSGAHSVPNELSTLCALYVVTGRLDKGQDTCQAAVEVDRSDAAFNNRGVYRAHSGDTEGALEDFRRVRVAPENESLYVEELKRRNARLMASRNFTVAIRYIERRKNGQKRKAGVVSAASVEDLIQ